MPAAHGKAPLRKSLKLKSRRFKPIKKKHHYKTRKQPSLKAVTKHGKTTRYWKPASLPVDNSRTLRKLQRNNTLMTKKAKMIMITFVKKLYKWVSVEAERLRRERQRPSIGFIEMRKALKSVMPVKSNTSRESASRSGGAGYTKSF